MRLASEIAVRQPPHFREQRIVQHQPPIGAEDRHAFIQRVERGFLDLGKKIEGGFQLQFLADILTENEYAAVPMRPGDDADALSRWQMPGFLDGLSGGGRSFDPALAPFREIALLGDEALLPQMIEDIAQQRMSIQPRVRQVPEPSEGRVVSRELAGSVEGSDRDRQLVDHPRVAVLVPRQFVDIERRVFPDRRAAQRQKSSRYPRGKSE